jgi:hypothetical protein
VYAFVTALRDARPVGADPDGPDRFTIVCLVGYVVTGIAIWVFAFGDYLDATGGRTADGGEVGSVLVAALGVTIGCALVAIGETAAARRRGPPNVPTSGDTAAIDPAGIAAPAT